MKPVDPKSQGGRILAVLADGPATTGEVSAEIGVDIGRVCAHLRHLVRTGRVTRAAFPTGNHRVRFLWFLADGVEPTSNTEHRKAGGHHASRNNA